jgi:hypothetical protein
MSFSIANQELEKLESNTRVPLFFVVFCFCRGKECTLAGFGPESLLPLGAVGNHGFPLKKWKCEKEIIDALNFFSLC